jgi:DNA-binding XRE family transcriptional regulator
MSATKNYSILRDELRKDPKKAKQMDAGFKKLLREQRQMTICHLRKSLNITQSQMAEMMNVSQSTISQLENGVIEMSLTMLYSLVDHLGGELQLNAGRTYLLYGFGGLFIMGLGIRAMLVGQAA